MGEQEKALKMLELLKGTGVSFRSFADSIGMNVESLYSYRSCPHRMSKERALYIIAQIERRYNDEWLYIKEQMEKLVQ